MIIMYWLWVFSPSPRRYSVIPPLPVTDKIVTTPCHMFCIFYTGVLGARFGLDRAHHSTFLSMVGIRSANYRFYEWIRIYSMRKIPLLYPLDVVFTGGRAGRQGRLDWIGLGHDDDYCDGCGTWYMPLTAVSYVSSSLQRWLFGSGIATPVMDATQAGPSV
ncbi:hypothetical protein GE09DRAFT_201190 [Coniochaeta sp. 2T2.1]|nr:hypothetical protein GE09DRAFT_201190 [Coniochaeta sp. 2T2.1]